MIREIIDAAERLYSGLIQDTGLIPFQRHETQHDLNSI